MGDVSLLVATRKGAFVLRGGADRTSFTIDGPHFLGHQVHHLVLDPRDGRTLLAAVRTGHLGPTIFRSTDGGKTFGEIGKPPAFRKKEGGDSVHHVFWLTPGRPEEPGLWYAGTSPHGLFRSLDGGETWEGLDGINENPLLATWKGDFGDQTPDGGLLHSVIVDPRDPDHLYVGMSGGGTFESTDGAATWTPLNKGVAADFLPGGETAEFGHDPHCVVLHPADPDRLYQQNHCGIYRLDRPGDEWVRIGDNMPEEIGDIGFPIVVHPRAPDTAWVFPMDGTDVWPRTSPGGKPAAYRTRDGGETWERQDSGFPREQAWFTVLRQSMANDDLDPVGLYLGTTCGEIWASPDEGESFSQVASHLPKVFGVEVARFE